MAHPGAQGDMGERVMLIREKRLTEGEELKRRGGSTSGRVNTNMQTAADTHPDGPFPTIRETGLCLPG